MLGHAVGEDLLTDLPPAAQQDIPDMQLPFNPGTFMRN